MDSTSLEQAQRWYGTLVPWELDNKDLNIIRKWRNQYQTMKDKEENTNKLTQKLWRKAQK